MFEYSNIDRYIYIWRLLFCSRPQNATSRPPGQLLGHMGLEKQPPKISKAQGNTAPEEGLHDTRGRGYMALDKGGRVPQDWGGVHGTKEGLHGTGEGLYNPGQPPGNWVTPVELRWDGHCHQPLGPLALGPPAPGCTIPLVPPAPGCTISLGPPAPGYTISAPCYTIPLCHQPLVT